MSIRKGTILIAGSNITNSVIDQADNTKQLKMWTGTKAEYEALEVKNCDTLYNITDDQDVTLSLLETIYPVGSIYIGTMTTCPLIALFGTWQLKASDRVLQGAGTRGNVGTTVNESLPNIKGSYGNDTTRNDYFSSKTGAIYGVTKQTTAYMTTANNTANSLNSGFYFDASRSSSTYQNDAPVQQDAYLVNIWERVA